MKDDANPPAPQDDLSKRRLVRTEAEAMQGVVGEDYFPKDTCGICGAVLYFDGLRYVYNHDAAKHRVDAGAHEGVPARGGESHSIGDAIARATDAARQQRRNPWTERDDE